MGYSRDENSRLRNVLFLMIRNADNYRKRCSVHDKSLRSLMWHWVCLSVHWLCVVFVVCRKWRYISFVFVVWYSRRRSTIIQRVCEIATNINCIVCVVYVYLLSINYVYSNLIFSHAVYEKIMYSICNEINIIKRITTTNTDSQHWQPTTCYCVCCMLPTQHAHHSATSVSWILCNQYY